MDAAIARFDKEYKKANSYEIMGIKFLKWFCTFLGMALMMIVPFPTDKMVVFMTWAFLWMCVSGHNRERCYFTLKGKRISVYKIIGSTPINRKMYIKNRCSHLYSYLIKFAAVAEFMMLIGLLIEGEFNLAGILRTLVILVVYFASYTAFGVVDIYVSTR